MPLDIPGHEHYVSAVELEGESIVVRMLSDPHAGTDASAFEVRAKGVSSAQHVLQYLTRAKELGEYLYAYEREDWVVFSDESGDEVAIKAEVIEVHQDELNNRELREALERVRANSARDDQSWNRLSSRLQNTREIIEEQLRRLQVKAASHESDSVAGILYAQQIQFLQRAHAATEAQPFLQADWPTASRLSQTLGLVQTHTPQEHSCLITSNSESATMQRAKRSSSRHSSRSA